MVNDIIIRFPYKINIETLNKMIIETERKISILNRNHNVIWDYTNCHYITPTGAVYIAMLKDKLHRMRINQVNRYYPDRPLSKFLKLFGLLKTIEDDSYIEAFKSYTVDMHKCYCIDDWMKVNKSVINKVVNRTNCDKSTQVAIDYILGELSDNAGCHGYQCYNDVSFPHPIYICAFSYRNKIEFAIGDSGQGIQNSLRSTETYKNINAKDALEKCIEYGVSGHPDSSPGFGLYSAYELAKSNNGKFHIWSSGRMLSRYNSGISTDKSSLHEGTLISLEINKDVNMPVEEILNKHRHESAHWTIDEYFEENIEELFEWKE